MMYSFKSMQMSQVIIPRSFLNGQLRVQGICDYYVDRRKIVCVCDCQSKPLSVV